MSASFAKQAILLISLKRLTHLDSNTPYSIPTHSRPAENQLRSLPQPETSSPTCGPETSGDLVVGPLTISTVDLTDVSVEFRPFDPML